MESSGEGAVAVETGDGPLCTCWIEAYCDFLVPFDLLVTLVQQE
jgi:hypothetical protein